MLNIVLSLGEKSTKPVLKDSKSSMFPKPAKYEVERWKNCEPFKIPLGEPEVDKSGDYRWWCKTEENLLLLILCVTHKDRRLYREGKIFQVRIYRKNRKKPFRRKLTLVA
ncbi:hypothetical protein COB87_001255 [Candidatus Wolfebacteria bacterium]|nr:hypothetical protein [Candidatus Wolfebacteria bacterium]